MYRIFIFLTGVMFFLSYSPIFAVGGPGGGSSSEAAPPNLQPPPLRAVFGSQGSSSSVITGVLPPLSLGALLNQALSFTGTITTREDYQEIEAHLRALEDNVDMLEGLGNLEDAENGGAAVEVFELSPELRAKVAAAIENRKLTTAQGDESELFTSDELQKLQYYFNKNHSLKNADIYNICLLFLSLNIGSMPLDLHNEDTFNYKLLFCLLENILSSNSDATKFQRAKAEILHCALVIFNQHSIISETLDEKIWFYREGFKKIDPGATFFYFDKIGFQKAQQEFYFRKLLVWAFQEFNNFLWQSLSLEACSYAAAGIQEYNISKILDNELIGILLRERFGTCDTSTADFELIFEFLSTKIAKIVRYVPSSISHTQTDTMELYLHPDFSSINRLLQGRIALACGLLNKHVQDNCIFLRVLFEQLLQVDPMDLTGLPRIDRAIAQYIATKNIFFAQGYPFQLPSLKEYIINLQDGETLKESSLLFQSALFYYLSDTEKQNFVEKKMLLKKHFEEEFERFEKWQKEHSDNFPPNRILAIYMTFSRILFHSVGDDFFKLSAEEYQKNVQHGVKLLWMHRINRGNYRNNLNTKELEIYIKAFIETIVTSALLYHKENGTFPGINTLIPMKLKEFRAFLMQYWVPLNKDEDKIFLSYILYLIYPKDILLEDVGVQSNLSLDDICTQLNLLFATSEALKNYIPQQKIIEEYINSTKFMKLLRKK